MQRLVIVVVAALIASSALGDEKKGRADDGQRSAKADCAHQANERKLKGKERRNFMKDCSKQAKQHDKDRGQVAAPGVPKTTTPTAQPTPTAPPPAVQTPAATAPTVPAAQPTPAPAPQPTATAPQPTATASQPAVTTTAKRTAPNSPERRTECQNSEEYRKATLFRRPTVLDKCMAAP